MKFTFLFIFLYLFTVLFAIRLRISLAPDPNCCAQVFKGNNFQGDSTSFCGFTAMVGEFWNDQVKSVKPELGCAVELFEGINYGGSSTGLLYKEMDSLGDLDDTASSLKVYRV